MFAEGVPASTALQLAVTLLSDEPRLRHSLTTLKGDLVPSGGSLLMRNLLLKSKRFACKPVSLRTADEFAYRAY